MKSFIALALVGLALVSGLKVQNEVSTDRASNMLAPLQQVLADIEKEKQDDLNTIAHHTAKLNARKEESAAAVTKFEASVPVAASKLKLWHNCQVQLKIREEEYASNDGTRTSEEQKINGISQNFEKLRKTGPADGTIGSLPKSGVAAAAAGLEFFLQTKHSKSAAKALNLLQRSSEKISTMTDAIASLTNAIVVERGQDVVAVDNVKKTCNAANTVYENADAARVSLQNEKDEAADREAVAKSVLKHQEELFANATKIRDADIATINKALDLIKDLEAVHATNLAGPAATQTQRMLQVPTSSKGSIQTVRDMITTMTNDVNEEETMQKQMLTITNAQLQAANAKKVAAEEAHRVQNETFFRAEKAWMTAYGEFRTAEAALAEEIAVAQQEQATINAVREMLKKLQSAEADILGDCPVDKIGAVCSGFGSCETNQTNPAKKYCSCKPGSGRTGRVCDMCKFGWRMATGELSGFCKQVYVPAVTFLQTDSSKQTTVADLNDAVVSMLQAGRHSETASGVEELLSALEKDLVLKEKSLRSQRDAHKRTHDESEKSSHAAKALLLTKAEELKVAVQAQAQMEGRYMMIYTMYHFEHPLRQQELQLLAKLDKILVDLAGGPTHTNTVLKTAPPVKAQNTHAPTSAYPTAAIS